MAIDKDFVIKNGLQVNENLIYADPDTDKVGLGTTSADKRLVVIGDQETSQSLSVGTTVTAQRLVTSGFTTAVGGVDVGVGGTIFSTRYDATDINGPAAGINSADPRYTLEVIGPVSIGDTAGFIYGDLTVTGDIRGASLSGQISAGGTVGFTNVTVEKNLVANGADIFTLFRLQEFGGDRYRFLTAGDPPGIGFTQNQDNPDLYLSRGQHYQFDVDSGGFPFAIKTQPTADLNNIYNDGVVNNQVQVGIVTFKVPFNSPNELYYQATNTAGMGGKIFVTNDGRNINVAIATVTQWVDASTAPRADFLNIYVSGIGTINNLKGPQNFSVSAGILTVRQDQTALIGVSTGTDFVSIQEKSDNTNYQVPFTPTLGIGSNYQNIFVDGEDGQMMYNPSTNYLTVNRVFGNLSGIATGADNINIDASSVDSNLQVTFSDDAKYDYQRQLIDSNSDRFLYNPATNTLQVTNIIATNVTAGLAGTATRAEYINVDERNDGVSYQILFNDTNGTGYQRPYIDTNDAHLSYNPATNTLSGLVEVTANNFTGSLTGTADQADLINVDENNTNTTFQVLFSDNQGAGYQRPYIDSDSGQFSYNPHTRTLGVKNISTTDITGSSFSGISNRADYINVDENNTNTTFQVLFSDNQAAGYQRPYIDSDSGEFSYNPATRTFSVKNISTTDITGSSFSGISNRADYINVDEIGTNSNYQVLFSTNQATGYQRPYIDNESGKFVYNPHDNRLTVGNFTGNGAGLTNLGGDKITTGTISPARLPSATNTIQGAVIVHDAYPPTSTSPVQPSSVRTFKKLYDAVGNLLPTGTVMLFYQANAPVGWTKITNQDNKALRVVGGAGGGYGGSDTFTSTFSSGRAVPLLQHGHPGSANYGGGSHSHSGTSGNPSANHTHGGATNADGDHRHGYWDQNGAYGASQAPPLAPNFWAGNQWRVTDPGGYHAHAFTTNGQSQNHTHSINTNSQSTSHSHSVTVNSTGTASASMDFDVRYIDVIICSKN